MDAVLRKENENFMRMLTFNTNFNLKAEFCIVFSIN
jgi:hypothetical protein